MNPNRAMAVVAVVVAAIGASGCTVAPTRSEVAPPAPAVGSVNDATTAGSVAQQVLPSIVAVEARQGDRVVIGSGFRVAIPGAVVTSAHLAEGADEVAVVLHDGTRRVARVLGSAPGVDIAVLGVDDTGLPPLHSGSGLADARTGDPVFAISHSSGRTDAVTPGTVLSLRLPVRLGEGGPELAAVQVDAEVTAGSSGGPLVDAQGDVLGVLTELATPLAADAPTGSAFAIPVDVARGAVMRIVANR